MLPVSLLVGFGLLAMILGADGDPARAMGGLDAAAFVYALWEHLCCIGIIVLLLRFFRRRSAGQGPRLQSAALDSYATYILHPLVIVGLAVAPAVRGALPTAQIPDLRPDRGAGLFCRGASGADAARGSASSLGAQERLDESRIIAKFWTACCPGSAATSDPNQSGKSEGNVCFFLHACWGLPSRSKLKLLLLLRSG